MKKIKLDNLSFDAKITPVKPVNDQFTLVKVWILYENGNRNGSHMSKEVIEKASPTLANVPIVGHIYENEDGELVLGSHDQELKKNKDGKYELKPLTTPWGVVPESHNAHFEEVKEEDGRTNLYYVCDALLWTGRFPEIFEVSEGKDGEILMKQSMEITPTSVEKGKGDKEGLFVINDFVFSALCMISAEPCFEGAKIKSYQFNNDFNEQFSEMRELLSACFNNEKFSKEVEEMDKEEELKDENTKTIPEIEEPVASEVENTESENEPETNTEAEEIKEFSTEFSLSYKEKFNALINAVAEMDVCTETEYVFYNIADFDERYCYVNQAYYSQEKPMGEYTQGRISYSESAGKIEIDISSYTQMFVKWLTAQEVEAVEQLHNDFATLEKKVKEFEKKELQTQLQEVASEFVDLHEDEEFKSVLEKASDYTVESFREKLFAIRGKRMSFSKKQEKKEVKIPFGIETTKDAPYGGIVENYLNKN